MSLFALEGRTAVVTGGGSGLGRLFALALAEAGAAVAVIGRRLEPLESTADEIRRRGRDALAIGADVTDESAVRAAVDRTLATFGAIDVLVNNAVGFHRAPVSTQPLAEWQRVLDVSVTGAFLCCRAVGPHMIARRSGRIINVASVYGVVGRDLSLYAENDLDSAQSLPYATSKGALLSLTRDLAAGWGRYGITVNAVSPGMFGRIDAPDRGLPPDVHARLVARTPMGRLGEPDDLRGVIVFLASNASAFITGHNLVVDGGWTIW